MSRRSFCPFVVLAIVTAGGTTAPAEDHAAAAGDVVSLTVRETGRADDRERPAPILARELVRQAFLIAARDECGLLTRDASLRESIPVDPGSHTFELFCTVGRGKKDFDIRYTLSRRNGKDLETLWEWTFQGDVFNPDMFPKLAEAAEELSRGPFKDLLKKEMAIKQVPAAREFAGVPRDTQHQLWEWNEFAVFGAVRRIHSEIRAKGESPELLGGLAIGYGNLASLTEYYYSPAQKAFAARALLYAERLLHQSDDSPLAHWQRGYARALIGLHEQARRDVVEAKKLQAGARTPQLPFWTDVLDAFCQGQLPRMLANNKTRDPRRLGRYLYLQAILFSHVDDMTIKSGQSVVEECHDCFRAWDSLCPSGQIGIVQMVTARAFPLLSKSIRDRLGDVYGFPPSLLKRLHDTKAPGDEEETGKTVDDEVEFRVQFVTDLKAETASGRDSKEPSLDALGQMIEEAELKQLIRRLELEANVWGVPTAHTIATYRPLVERHPYGAYVDAFSQSKPPIEKAVADLFRQIEPADLTLTEASIIGWLYRHDAKRGMVLWTVLYNHADPVFRDEMNGIENGLAGVPDEKKMNGPYMQMVWRTSSKLPLAYAIQIDRNWKRAKFFANTVEKDYADDPIVMRSLTNRYFALKQYDDSERCAKQRIHTAPDYPAYEALAGIYKAKGDMVRWKETLEKSLELPAMGLQHAGIQNTIANYHMDRKEWKEAVVYADAAAESYSEWSMMTAARCHEMLNHWEKAEQFMRNISERYDDSAMEWMLWCYRTGHGDTGAADSCARAHFESLGTSFYWPVRERIGIYYILRNEPEKALVVFKQTFEQGHNAYDGMHAAMLADALGKTADRDKLLSEIISADAAKNPQGKGNADLYKQLAELMRKSLPPGSLKDFAYDKVDAVISKSPKDEAAANFEYFVGMFLKNRGEVEKSNRYLIRSAQSPFYNKFNHILALRLLRDLKVAVPPVVAENTKAKK